MGLIESLFGMLFGGRTNVVKDTAELFRENAEAGAVRAHATQSQAMIQFGQEFEHARKGYFDRFIDGLNRIPRPAMALGVLGLFVSAMASPLWFAERMQGIALVPEPLWWLLGVIVSFYFGARHQVKTQQFQRDLAASVAQVPTVLENIRQIRSLSALSPGAASAGTDAELQVASIEAGTDGNAAVHEWQQQTA